MSAKKRTNVTQKLHVQTPLVLTNVNVIMRMLVMVSNVLVWLFFTSLYILYFVLL